ncbi:UDP-N-acetylglucosamine 2-epimerase [Mucisphaera sp.]|uniref:UDP-N-acetylglucosamine 2-epimerase n=1 Tax=Mucisphaera sp. TaxID=2913024 RepID=UPI003D0C8E1C
MPSSRPKRRIAIVTGTRAEFGLLRTVIDHCLHNRKLTTQLYVTGTHLTLGTDKDICAARYPITARIPMQKKTELGRSADAQALGRGVTGFTKAFAKHKPDVIMVLGDRIEAFAAASAASIAGIRVAHIHGGDRAEGVADEAIRHAITKLAHLHFPATATSRRRLIRLGEHSSTIHQVGSPAIDGLDQIVSDPHAPRAIVLHHPIGDDPATEARRMHHILKATAHLKPLVLSPNADPGADGILRAIQQTKPNHLTHLKREDFLSLLAGTELLIGNSSTGLIEAAALGTPAINIGPRQAGRERPASVIDCADSQTAIRRAIRYAINQPPKRRKHPYGNGTAGQQIACLLASFSEQSVPLRKQNSY